MAHMREAVSPMVRDDGVAVYLNGVEVLRDAGSQGGGLADVQQGSVGGPEVIHAGRPWQSAPFRDRQRKDPW